MKNKELQITMVAILNFQFSIPVVDMEPGMMERLGDLLSGLMEERISPRQARFELVSGLWSELLPAELRQHCRLADISGGQLKVLVDSPSYAHELRLCSSELLSELQQRCPRGRIKKIKIAIG